jgi:RNA polymerase sigma factor (sigma-70 family)
MSCETREVETAETRLDFDDIFTLFHRLIFRVAFGIVRESALAEDVTQEVFLKLYHNLETAPRSEELLRAWLLRVCINVARNTMRGSTRALARESKFAAETLYGEGATETPADEYEKRMEIIATHRALDKLKEPTRSCLLLQQQGLGYREIAAVLSLNEKSVGSLIARGRKEFARVYGKIGGC